MLFLYVVASKFQRNQKDTLSNTTCRLWLSVEFPFLQTSQHQPVADRININFFKERERWGPPKTQKFLFCCLPQELLHAHHPRWELLRAWSRQLGKSDTRSHLSTSDSISEHHTHPHRVERWRVANPQTHPWTCPTWNNLLLRDVTISYDINYNRAVIMVQIKMKIQWLRWLSNTSINSNHWIY